MAGLVKEVELKILASDGDDAQARLDAIAERAEELKEEHPDLAVRIDTAAASEKLKVLKDELKEAAGSADDSAEALKRYQDAAERAAGAADDLARVQKDDSASADDVAAAQDRATQATLASLDAQMRLVGAEEKAALAGKANADSQDESAGKTDLAAAEAGKAGKRLNDLALGAGAAAAGAVYLAVKWQEASTQLVTGAGQSEKGLDAVKSGMLAVSTQTATSASQVQAGMYMIESAGFHGAQGLDVLKAAAEGAKVGNAQLGDVANVVTSALNAYHLPASAAVAVTNQLVATVASGKMHMQDLATSISNVLPIAASAHISFAQVGGALATMTAQGMTARRASMNLANMIRALVAPSATASGEMKALGLNANEVSKNVGREGLTGTLDILTEAILRNSKGGTALADSFNGMDPATKNLARGILAGTVTTNDLTDAEKGMSVQQAALITSFAKTAGSATGLKTTFDGAMKTMVGGATGLNVALLLGGKHAEAFAGNVKSVADAAAHSGKDVSGWAQITADTAFKLDQAKDSAENLGIAVGSALLPAVTAILGPLASAAGWLADNKVAAMALAGVVGGVLAVYLGVKAVNAFNSIKKAADDVGSGLQWLGAKFGILGGEQEAQAAATSASADSTDALTAKMAVLRGETEAQTVATEAETVAQEEADAAMDANPIGIIIIALAALAVGIYEVVRHWKDFRQWGEDAWKAVSTAAEDAWHFIDDQMIHPLEHGIDDLVNWVDGHWRLLATIIATVLLGPIAGLVVFVATHWSQITSLTGRLVSDVTGWFERLPGDILHALGDLGSLLFHAGENIIEGLLNGIKSAAGGVLNYIGGLGHDVSSAFSSALHMLSPSKVFEDHGRNIMLGLQNGIEASAPRVLDSMRKIASDLGGAGAGSYGGGGFSSSGGGAAGGVLKLEWVNGGGADQQFLTWLQNNIRARGGSPQIINRKVVFA